MKIAISTLGENLDAPFDYRFKHASHILILDSKKLQYNKLPVLEREEEDPSDTEVARSIIEKGVNVLVTGNCSSRASDILSDAHVRLFNGKEGSVKDNVLSYYKKRLRAVYTEHYTIREARDVHPAEPDEEELWEIIPGHIPENGEK